MNILYKFIFLFYVFAVGTVALKYSNTCMYNICIYKNAYYYRKITGKNFAI